VKSPRAGPIAVVALLITAVVISVDITALNARRVAHALATRGVPTTATVEDLYKVRGTVSIPEAASVVTYRFEVEGERYVGVARVGEAEFSKLKLGGPFEAVYLPERPAICAPETQAGRRARSPSPGLIVVANMVAVAVAVWVATGRMYVRSRRLPPAVRRKARSG
jgi:hypothetical protein